MSTTTSPPPPPSEGATVEPFPCGTACTVGLRVMHVDRFHLGTVRFIGTVRGAPSKGPMLGVEWDKPEGLNDGSRAGTVYFTCKPKHGSFLAASKVMPPQLLDDVLTERYTMTVSSTRGIGNDPRVREEGTGAFINVKSCDCSASASLAVAGRVSPQFPALFPHLADLSITDALFVDWEPIKTLCTGLKFLVRLNIRGNKVGSLDKFLTSLAPSRGAEAATANCDKTGACDDDNDVEVTNETSMWSSSMETFNAASTGVTSDCFPHFFTLFPKLKSLHVGFNQLTELRTPKPPSSIATKPSADHLSSKKVASTETEAVAKQGSLNDETTKKTATTEGEGDAKTFHLQDLILDTNKFTSLSTLAAQLGPVLCSTIQTLNINNNPIENVEHRCDGLPSTMPAPGVDTGIPAFRKFVRCADAIKSMDSVSSSPDGRAASTTSGNPNSTSRNSGDENEDRGEGGDGQNGKNGDTAEGEIPKGMVRNPLTEAQHVAQFCFSQKHSLFPALSSLLMRDSAVKAWDDLIPLFDLPLIREVCFSSPTLCGKIASRENRRRVVIAMLPPHLTRLNQSFITKKERESARYHVINEWILQEQEEAQLAACATPLEPNLPPAALASDNTNDSARETGSTAAVATTSENSASSAAPKATFQAAVHKSVQAFQRILMEDRGGSTAETEIFIPTKKLLETHFDVTVHVVFGTPRPVQALFAQYFLPLVLSSNQPSTDGGGAGGAQGPNVSPGRFVGASGDSVQSSLNEDKARKKSTLPTAFAELAVNRASVEDLLAGAQPSAPPPAPSTTATRAQSDVSAGDPVCATTSGMRGGSGSSVDVGAVWHAQFDGECHIKMDVATLKRNIVEQYVIVARRMLPDGHPQKLTGSAGPSDTSGVDNSASSASSAVHGLKPSDGLLVFLLDHELMENPGAIRQGFFCKEMFPDSALLRNWRMASGHHVVVCVVDGGKAMLSRAPNASAVTALCSF